MSEIGAFFIIDYSKTIIMLIRQSPHYQPPQLSSRSKPTIRPDFADIVSQVQTQKQQVNENSTKVGEEKKSNSKRQTAPNYLPHKTESHVFPASRERQCVPKELQAHQSLQIVRDNEYLRQIQKNYAMKSPTNNVHPSDSISKCFQDQLHLELQRRVSPKDLNQGVYSHITHYQQPSNKIKSFSKTGILSKKSTGGYQGNLIQKGVLREHGEGNKSPLGLSRTASQTQSKGQFREQSKENYNNGHIQQSKFLSTQQTLTTSRIQSSKIPQAPSKFKPEQERTTPRGMQSQNKCGQCHQNIYAKAGHNCRQTTARSNFTSNSLSRGAVKSPASQNDPKHKKSQPLRTTLAEYHQRQLMAQQKQNQPREQSPAFASTTNLEGISKLQMGIDELTVSQLIQKYTRPVSNDRSSSRKVLEAVEHKTSKKIMNSAVANHGIQHHDQQVESYSRRTIDGQLASTSYQNLYNNKKSNRVKHEEKGKELLSKTKAINRAKNGINTHTKQQELTRNNSYLGLTQRSQKSHITQKGGKRQSKQETSESSRDRLTELLQQVQKSTQRLQSIAQGTPRCSGILKTEMTHSFEKFQTKTDKSGSQSRVQYQRMQNGDNSEERVEKEMNKRREGESQLNCGETSKIRIQQLIEHHFINQTRQSSQLTEKHNSHNNRLEQNKGINGNQKQLGGTMSLLKKKLNGSGSALKGTSITVSHSNLKVPNDSHYLNTRPSQFYNTQNLLQQHQIQIGDSRNDVCTPRSHNITPDSQKSPNFSKVSSNSRKQMRSPEDRHDLNQQKTTNRNGSSKRTLSNDSKGTNLSLISKNCPLTNAQAPRKADNDMLRDKGSYNLLLVRNQSSDLIPNNIPRIKYGDQGSGKSRESKKSNQGPEMMTFAEKGKGKGVDNNESLQGLIDEKEVSSLQLRKDKTEIKIDDIDIRIKERESSVGNLRICQRNISEEIQSQFNLETQLRLQQRLTDNQFKQRDEVQNILISSKQNSQATQHTYLDLNKQFTILSNVTKNSYKSQDQEEGNNNFGNSATAKQHCDIQADSQPMIHLKGEEGGQGVEVEQRSNPSNDQQEKPFNKNTPTLEKMVVPNQTTQNYMTVQMNQTPRQQKEEKEESRVEQQLNDTMIFSNKTSLDEYIIGKQIGQGAYAIVRIGLHKPSNQKVALKIYKKYKLEEPNRRRSVKREIKLMEKMKNDHVVRLFEIIDTSKYVILVMEFIGGGSLHGYLKASRNRRLEEFDARRIFRQILDGLLYCHARCITHRDIKLENVLLDDKGAVKLIDFGFSTCIPNDKKIKIFCGTPSYMAPEIVLKTEYCGPPADIWAFGVLLFTCITGQFPYRGATDEELYDKICRAAYIISPAVKDSLSEDVQDLIARLFTINADQRPSAKDLLKHPWFQKSEKQSTTIEPSFLPTQSLEQPKTTLLNSDKHRQDPQQEAQSVPRSYRQQDQKVEDKPPILRKQMLLSPESANYKSSPREQQNGVFKYQPHQFEFHLGQKGDQYGCLQQHALTQKNEQRKQIVFYPSPDEHLVNKERINERIVQTIVDRLGYTHEDIRSHLKDSQNTNSFLTNLYQRLQSEDPSLAKSGSMHPLVKTGWNLNSNSSLVDIDHSSQGASEGVARFNQTEKHHLQLQQIMLMQNRSEAKYSNGPKFNQLSSGDFSSSFRNQAQFNIPIQPSLIPSIRSQESSLAGKQGLNMNICSYSSLNPNMLTTISPSHSQNGPRFNNFVDNAPCKATGLLSENIGTEIQERESPDFKKIQEESPRARDHRMPHPCFIKQTQW